MGSDRTSQMPYDTIPGVLIPWEWQTRSATATDIDHAEPSPGADEYSGSGRVRIELTGTPSYIDSTGTAQVPTVIDLVTVPAMGVRGLTWAWKRDAAGHWFGQDRAVVPSDWAEVMTSAPTYPSWAPSVIVTQAGTVLAAAGRSNVLGTGAIYMRRRTAATWGAAAAVVDAGARAEPTDGVPTALAELPDGTILLFTVTGWAPLQWSLLVSASTDDGVTWYTLSVDAFTWAFNPPRVMRAAVLPDGRIVLAMTENTTSNSEVVTAVSRDGGATWEQIERADDAALSGIVVWDLRVIRGGLVAIVEAGNLGAGADTGIGWVEVTDPETAWVGATTTTTVTVVDTLTGDPRWRQGGCIAEDPDNASGYLVWYGIDMHRTSGVGGFTAEGMGSATVTTAQGQMVWWRGALCIVTGVLSSTTMQPNICELKFGGQADTTWTRDMMLDTAGLDEQARWWAITTIGDQYTTSDDTSGGGTVTRSHSIINGQRIVTTNALGRYVGNDFAGYAAAAVWAGRVRVAGGTFRVTIIGSTSGAISASSYTIIAEVTGTQIRIGDGTAGTWSNWSNHGATSADYLTVEVVLEANEILGRVYWRTDDDLYPYTSTGVIEVGSLTATTAPPDAAIVRFGAEASSDVYLRWCWSCGRYRIIRDGLPAVNWSESDHLIGVPLTQAEPRYIADGMDGRILGGIPRMEPTTLHRFTITSSSAYEHMFPEVVASPRYGWTMSSTRDQTIRLKPTPDGTAKRRMPSEIFGIYLGGLSAVPSFTLTGFAYDASIDVDLRLPYRYTGTGTGYSVVADTSGTGNDLDGPWVGHDELVGCLFECEDGLRTIIGNSPGHLCSGDGSEAGLRATIHLDGTPGVDALGYIWPKQAMVIVYDTNSRVWPGEITLVIDSALADLGDGTRTIGTLAAGPIVPLGMAFDRTRADEYVVGDVLTTLPDGTAFVSSQDPGRRRMEVAYVATVHDATAQAPGGAVESMPDWIEVPSPGGTQAGADRDPVMPMWSLLAAHGRQPLVLVHMSRSDTSGSVDVQTPSPYRYGTLYCRQMGAPRWEQVPTGPGSLSAESWRMVRMNVMSFEEIP